jgi:hypothetical protein
MERIKRIVYGALIGIGVVSVLSMVVEALR